MRKFHFIKHKTITLIILAVVLVAGILSFGIRKFNIDIDFSGGTEIQIDLGVDVTNEVCDKVDAIIEEKIGHEYVSATGTTASTVDPSSAIIRTGTKPLTVEQQATLEAALVEAYPETNVDNIEVTTIQPSIGSELTKKAFLAVGIAVLLMLIYITIRFEFASGVAAVVCLGHDLFVMFAVYSLLQIPINSNIIAALLTILGYSINATIIVFDRVRENRKNNKEDLSFGDIVNNSVHDTLGRSINTTITTLLTIGMIYILGVDSIKDFALPLIVGIVSGLFSSVFVSGLVWVGLDKILPKKKKATK